MHGNLYFRSIITGLIFVTHALTVALLAKTVAAEASEGMLLEYNALALSCICFSGWFVILLL